MCDRDIRNFFKSDGSKSSTNKSKMIKQIVLDPKKDMKKITKKPLNEKKSKKTKIKVSEEQKKEEKKEFSTPVKKKLIEVKKNKNDIKVKKSNINLSKNKKVILDEDDDNGDNDENMEIIKEKKEAGNLVEKQNNNKNKIEKEKEKEKENYTLPPPVKKKEKLIPITVSEFFSSKRITLKTDKQFQKEKSKEIKKENIINENKMEIDEEEINPEKEEIKKDKKNEMNAKNNNNVINHNNNDGINNDIINDIIMETENENENNKNLEKKENKIKLNEKEVKNNVNKIHNDKVPSKNKNEVKNFPIKREIKREIKKEDKAIQKNNNNLNNDIKQQQAQIPLSELWTDKYIPKQISDIIGNQQQLRNLETWLDNWDNCILRGHKNEEKNKTGKKFSKNENVNARAAIISGPPGIGKTSSVRVLTRNKGYRTFELNASDKRNKDTINNSVGFLMNNTTLSSIDNSTMTKNIIIMDEVDGMAGNEDKGGIKALIDIVKKTKVPIIFICNDIYSPKLKSLLNYCYDIRFNRPDKRQIVLRLIEICKNEGIFIDNQTLTYLVESFGNDIRQTINYLDLCSRTKRNVNDIKKNCEEVKKDKSVTVSSFDICKILLNKAESSKLNFEQKLDLFFVDFDLIPGMIYENYLGTAGINSNSINKKESLKKIVDGLDHMSFSDTVENRMKTQMEWSLLPDRGIHSTVLPSMIFSSFLGFPRFPTYINKISTIIKINRELKELKKIFNNYSLYEIKNLVGPLFYNIIIDKLVKDGKNGIDRIVDILANYRMSSNLFKENLYDLQTKENQDLYNKINTSIKTSLTKKLNERFKTSLKQHKSKTIMMPKIKVDKDGNLLDDFEDDDVDEEEADDQSSSFFEPIKKVNKKKNK